MGKRGPPRKPTALKLLEGNPGKRRLPDDEPAPKRGKPVCPPWVCDFGKQLWAKYAPDLIREGLLTKRDEEEFAGYCHERAIYAMYSDLLKELKPKSPKVERYRAIALKANDRAQRLGARFGMTPSDRVGMHVTAPKPPSDEEFLFGHRDAAP